MVKLFDSAQMRAADAAAIAAGISGRSLMAAAGAAVAERLTSLFPACSHTLVLCGTGNNGGDGYVAARRLVAAGLDVTVLELGRPKTADASAARSDLLAADVEPRPLDLSSLEGAMSTPVQVPAATARGTTPETTTVIVDALLGCGLDRPLTGLLADVVDLVNASGLPVLAVDVPTGVDADSPRPPGPHVRASATVQLAGPKLASAFHPAREAYARTRGCHCDVADIGIPASILDSLSDVTLLTNERCRDWLPQRSPTAHKYSAGTVTIVAGSRTYAGAAELACRGAWRGGAGLVTLVGSNRHPSAWPETVFRRLGREWPPRGMSAKAAAACVVGPGLSEESATVLPRLLAWAPGPVVIDATALTPSVLWPALDSTAITADEPPRSDAPSGAHQWVLTPHAGEAARLLGVAVEEVDSDPLAAAARLAERSAATVVLKGPTTVVAAPSGRLAVSTRGHPGMASGGTGDVLAGLIGALAAAGGRGSGESGATPRGAVPAQGVDLFQRTCIAVFVHGVAGERAALTHGDSLVASDLVAHIAGVLADLAAGG